MKPSPNKYVDSRLRGIYDSLMSGFSAGSKMSSATKGTERELFVEGFLRQVFPAHYRFASGDITDKNEYRSGQVDVVVESQFLYSFPAFPSGPRLFPAESAAAIIEVKSNIKSQWDEVVAKVKDVRKIERRFLKHVLNDWGTAHTAKAESISPDRRAVVSQIANQQLAQSRELPEARTDIPIYAIGFGGWKTMETVEAKRAELDIDGVIVLESLIGAFGPMRTGRKSHLSPGIEHGTCVLWRLLDSLAGNVFDTINQQPSWLNYYESMLKRNGSIDAT